MLTRLSQYQEIKALTILQCLSIMGMNKCCFNSNYIEAKISIEATQLMTKIVTAEYECKGEFDCDVFMLVHH